jgi:sulfhydrogenase subunit beta (sulfur reductase)
MDADASVLAPTHVSELIQRIRRAGFELVGPRISGKAIAWGPIESERDLPIGWTETQEAGTYRLQRRDDDRWFGFTVGPDSAKRFLFPPVEPCFRLDPQRWSVEFPDPARPLALFGLRGCDLAAIRVQDRVLAEGTVADARYRERRQTALRVAVECSDAAATCFCDSMGTGPAVGGDFDLCLTERWTGSEPTFLLRVGTARGRELIRDLGGRPAQARDLEAFRREPQRARAHMGRSMPPGVLARRVPPSPDHPRWNTVGDRCFACGNCTSVCPTCFCTTPHDETEFGSKGIERLRVWDSCFSRDFSYVSGRPQWEDVASRYGQWLGHKLFDWKAQFGTSGCVGCGRCITWCPAGIDLTEEVRALAAGDPAPAEPAPGFGGK